MGMVGFTHESPRNQSVEWLTPPWIFESLGIEFDLDPCGAEGDVVPARRSYQLPENDGLNEPWFGNCWVNPPYGRETPRWLARLVEHGHGIALVFARTDPDWFHKYGSQADAICFLRGRVSFIDGHSGQPAGRPAAGSMLLAYGADNAQALRRSGLGLTVANPREGAR